MGSWDIGSALSGLAAGALTDASVTIETTIAPPIVVGLGANTAGKSSWIVGVLKPKVTVMEGGVTIVQLAPGGDPGTGTPVLFLLMGMLVLLLLALAGWGV